VIDDGAEEPGCDGKVEDGIRRACGLRAQLEMTANALVRGRIIDVAGQVTEPLGEPVPGGLVERRGS
jgi:hypothetical protein